MYICAPCAPYVYSFKLIINCFKKETVEKNTNRQHLASSKANFLFKALLLNGATFVLLDKRGFWEGGQRGFERTWDINDVGYYRLNCSTTYHPA